MYKAWRHRVISRLAASGDAGGCSRLGMMWLSSAVVAILSIFGLSRPVLYGSSLHLHIVYISIDSIPPPGSGSKLLERLHCAEVIVARIVFAVTAGRCGWRSMLQRRRAAKSIPMGSSVHLTDVAQPLLC